MYPVSPAFLASVRQGGPRKTVIDLYYNQQLTRANIPITDWSVSSSDDSVLRTSGSCTVADPNLVPTLFNDDALLIPAGAELVIKTGFVYPGGVEELIPMGVFTVESVKWNDGRSSSVDVEFYDRAKVLERYNWLAPTDFSGRWISSVVSDLFTWSGSYITAPTFTGLVDQRLPGGSLYDSDRLESIKNISGIIGGEAFFDRNGKGVVQKIPNITSLTAATAAVWTVDAGSNGVLVSASKGLSRSGVFNAVIVYGAVPNEGTPQASARVKDEDPRSATYYNGPFGKVWEVRNVTELTNNTQCLNYANSLIAKTTGLVKSVDFQLVPNPALDVGDIILVKYYNGSQELHIITSFDLSNDSMSAKTRSIQWVVG